jgi:hypothetical protein
LRFSIVFKVEAAADQKHLLLPFQRKVFGQFCFFFGKPFDCTILYSKIVVNMEQSKLSPFTSQFMLINAPQFTVTLLRGYVVYLVRLVLAHRLAKLKPSAILFVFLSGSMSAATSRTIVLQFDGILSLTEGNTYLLSSENVPVKVLTEYLSSLVINFVLRIDHYAIFDSTLVKYFTDQLRMARVNEDQTR